MALINCVEDQRVLAQKRVPRMFYEYADGGSWTESTYHSNEKDWQSIKLKQRVGVDVSSRNTIMPMLGLDLPMPVVLGPVGLIGMHRADGEILAAKSAEEFGVPFTLSTMSICSIEDVAEHTSKPFWFQLYVMRDRDFIRRLLSRAKDANCSTLMVTIDLPILGDRYKDRRNGLSTPPKLTIKNTINLVSKPNWCFQMIKTRRRYFGNVVGHVKGVDDMTSLSDWVSGQFDPSLTWKDIEGLRMNWDRKLVIKGIMDPDDAKSAVDIGADAIVVSNHGGRQLDGTLSTVSALPAILDRVGGDTEVWVDGGIRSGQDILKAIALGARGTLLGRAYLYGLGSNGQAGVTQTLKILKRELDMSMALCGKSSLSDVDTSILYN
ncbi:MAG: alpha-hydroxy-acid oxidizing enzyme [Rhodospirillaceae bacterium]|nr:alpha-hydroxy-acid oxidizing enzyme [Rhodospirillaceae bacterium]|tara:strand:+ start:11354 stop:12490 length:1137 start_codon:yes stop_codon:yes gene_type:complete